VNGVGAGFGEVILRHIDARRAARLFPNPRAAPA
jgi:hypothetical protein